jgi:predicted RNase H-like HicB family nuclease
MKYRVDVIIEQDSDGYYAYCPALEGCQSQGRTFEEAMKNIQEAAELYLETLSPEELQALADRRVINTALEVAVA